MLFKLYFPLIIYCIFKLHRKNMMFIYSLSVSLALIFLSLFVYKYVVKPYRKFKYYQQICTSKYKTLIVPFSLLGYKTYARLKNDQKEHGDCHYTLKTIYPKYQIVLSNFISDIILDLIDPQLIKEFYQKTNQGFYQKCSHAREPFQEALGKGLLLSQGHQFKMRKKIISTIFNYNFVHSKIPAIIQICQDQIDKNQLKLMKKGNKIQMKVSQLFQTIFGNIIIKCFFGNIQLKEIEGKNIFDFVNEVFAKNTKRAYSTLSMVFGKKFNCLGLRAIDRESNRNLETFRKYTLDTIQRSVQSMKSSNFTKQSKESYQGVMDYLFHQKKLQKNCESADQETKQFYTFQDLVDEFATFFMAGSDTTSNSSTALIYLIALHPEVEIKIRKQLELVLQNKITNINEQTIKKLVYLDYAVKETLRMHSTFSGIMLRVATKDHMLQDIPIFKGTYVYVKSKSNHYKEENFENPFEFRPERWESIDIAKMKPYSYFPFSAGIRGCPGQHLSLIQSKIAIVMLLLRYKSISLEKKSFKFIQKILFAPEDLMVTFTK